jgi:hypothetical protein
MKAYNLKSIIHQASFGSVSALSLGESGRGRKNVLILCPPSIIDGQKVRVATPKVGKIKIETSDDNEDSTKWVARISTQGPYIRGAFGCVCVEASSKVKVLAEGAGAFGAAGRTGSWRDYLLEIPNGCWVKVCPTRGSIYFLHFEAKVVRLKPEEVSIYDREVPQEWITL